MSACIIRLIFRNRYIARLPCFVLSAMDATDIHICSVLWVQQEPRTCWPVSSGSSSGTDISLAYRASSCTTRAAHMSSCIIRLIFRNRYIARLPFFVLSAMAATDIHICSVLKVQQEPRTCRPVSSGSSSGTDISLAYRASSCQQWLSHMFRVVGTTRAAHMSSCIIRLIFRNRYIARLPFFVLSAMAATDIHICSVLKVQQEPRTCRPVSSGSSSGTDISLAYRASSCQQWLQLTYIYVPCCRYNKSHAHVGLYLQAHLPEPIYRLLTVLRLVNNGCN
ncbi:hypothetical protein J6590_018414 [Homalodisca vitripennis]|nr:hypothetical protein J6590_018414 [Homalodisca vitripennis]